MRAQKALKKKKKYKIKMPKIQKTILVYLIKKVKFQTIVEKNIHMCPLPTGAAFS